jgi:hypothetical protein
MVKNTGGRALIRIDCLGKMENRTSGPSWSAPTKLTSASRQRPPTGEYANPYARLALTPCKTPSDRIAHLASARRAALELVVGLLPAIGERGLVSRARELPNLLERVAPSEPTIFAVH